MHCPRLQPKQIIISNFVSSPQHRWQAANFLYNKHVIVFVIIILIDQAMECRCGGILFFSNFDSGNLASVEKVEGNENDGGGGGNNLTSTAPDYEFNVRTKPDCGGTPYENQNRSWFYFGLRGYVTGKQIKITILNMNKQGKLYTQGMSPLVRVVPYKPKWERTRDKTTHETVDGQFNLSFTYRFIGDANKTTGTTYFAFCFPWSYDESQKQMTALDLKYNKAIPPLIEYTPINTSNERSDSTTKSSQDASAAAARKDGEIYYHRELVCYTPDKRRVDLLTISAYENIMDEREPRIAGLFPDSQTSRCHRFKDKKVFFLSSRVHPGETPASHVYNGFLHFILNEKDARAKVLRQRYVFKLIPMLNPDGVYHGHYRTDFYGVNLNRFYLEPDPIRHSPIYASRALILFYHLYYSDNVETVNEMTANQSLADLFTDVITSPSYNHHRTTDAAPVAPDVTPDAAAERIGDERQDTTNQENHASTKEETTTVKITEEAATNDHEDSSASDGWEDNKPPTPAHPTDDHNGDEEKKTSEEPAAEKAKIVGLGKAKSWKEVDYSRLPPRDSGVNFYVDLHGHASKRGCFIYGNQIDDIEQQVDNLLYPRLIALNTQHFDFEACNFSEKNMYMKDKRDGLSKEGAGRVAMYKLTGMTHSYTLECNYNIGRTVNCLPPASHDGGRATPPPPTGFPPRYTIDIFENVGKALSIAALDFHQCNPWSRLPNSEFNTHDNLRQWMLRYVQGMRGSNVTISSKTNRYARNHKQHAITARLDSKNNNNDNENNTSPITSRRRLATHNYLAANRDSGSGGGGGASTRSERLSTGGSSKPATASTSSRNRRDFIKHNKNMIKAVNSTNKVAANDNASTRLYNKPHQVMKVNNLSPLSSPETTRPRRRNRQRQQPRREENGGKHSSSDSELFRLGQERAVNMPGKSKGRSISLRQYKLPTVQNNDIERKFSLDLAAGTVPYRGSPVGFSQSPSLFLQPMNPPPLIIATAISTSLQNSASKINIYDMGLSTSAKSLPKPRPRVLKSKKSSPTQISVTALSKKKTGSGGSLKQRNSTKLAAFTVPCTTR